MLDNITLENFKSFKKLEDLKVKPITILCGTNSCGKSSILQSILMLKQTFEGKNPNQNLLLNGRFVKLGYFTDLIHKKLTSNEVSFDLCFDISHLLQQKRGRGYAYFVLREILGRSMNDLKTQYLIDYKVTLKAISEKNYENNYLQPIQVSFASIKIIGQTNKGRKELSSISFKNISEDNYLVKWDNFQGGFFSSSEQQHLEKGKAELLVKFSNLLPVSIAPTNKDQTFRNDLDFIMSRLNDLFKIIFQSYTYLGPLRGEPEREYIYRDEIVEIGTKGENAAYLFSAEQDNLLSNHFFYEESKDGFIKLPQIDIKSAVTKWLDLMKINNFNSKTINKIIYLNLAASKYDETQVGIADVGFGVSQIFPIVLEGLRMDQGGTLLLEQPEIHLHPNLQMMMSDYFISLALSRKNVIVETHSDHVINRLVRRIVEDGSSTLKNLIGIYFFKPSENGTQFEEVQIDDMKGVVNWPVDFFDQTANEQMKIMQAGIKKRSKKRKK